MALLGPSRKRRLLVAACVSTFLAMSTVTADAHALQHDFAGRLGIGIDSPGQVASVVGVAVGPDGLIYDAEATSDAIQVFDSAGRYVRLIQLPRAGGVKRLTAIAMGPNGPVALDANREKLYYFNFAGRLLRALDIAKSATNEFDIVNHVAIDRAGAAYFTSDGANSVLKLSTTGVVLAKYPVRHANGVAVGADGTIYVPSTHQRNIQRVSVSGKRLSPFRYVWPTDPDGQFAAESVAVKPDGAIVAVGYPSWDNHTPADDDSGLIVSFDAAGNPRETLRTDSFVDFVAAGPDGSIVSSTTVEILKHDPSLSTVLAQVGSNGAAAGELRDTTAVDTDSAGNVFVSDLLSGFTVFNAKGKLVRTIPIPESVGLPTPGPHGMIYAISEDGHLTKLDRTGAQRSSVELRGLQSADSIDVDPAGDVFIANTDRHSVVSYGADGRIRHTYQVGGRNFMRPSAVAVDAKRGLFVADFRGRVLRFSLDGRYLGRFDHLRGKHRLRRPVSIKVDRSGLVYVADWGSGSWAGGDSAVYVLNRDGELVESIGASSGKHAPHFVESIAVGANGTVYVVDDDFANRDGENDSGSDSSRVQVFRKKH